MSSIDELLNLNKDIIFKLAETEHEKKEIYDSRYQIANSLFPYLFKTNNYGHVAKDEFDDHSYLFYCKKESIIGSCRATPIVKGRWEASDSLPDNINLDFELENTLQLNRVYVDENFRNRAIHEFLFYNFSIWVINNTNYDKYFAVCNAALVKMYQKIGAKLLFNDGFKLSNRLSHNYYMVGGRLDDFIATIHFKYYGNKKF